MIPQETISQIFSAARIEEVIGEFVHLKKRGANYVGLSPFTTEKTPSFTVSPVKNIFKCFSSGKGGNVVTFLMEHEQMTYPEALRFLAQKYNIEIEEKEQTAEDIAVANERESIYIVSEFANKYFQDQLWNTEKGRAIGLSYFKERGLTEEIIKKFDLGYSPEERNAFTKEALDKGYKEDYMIKAGLIIKKDDRPPIDRFWGRVMFPIHNLSGKTIAFAGRILKTEVKAAKYVNSPETIIYHKSNVLYGMHLAKKSIIEKSNCYLVEGYTDVISMHQKGVENIVASSGTALTVEQIRLIKRYSENVTVMYDGDAAGIKASLRGIDLILEEGLNVKVVLFPDGEDPDSFAQQHDKEEIESFIDTNKKDFILFKTTLLLKDVKNDPTKKATVIGDIIKSIALIPDSIKRALYVKEASNLLDIQEQILLFELNKILRFNQRNNKKKEEHNQPQAPEIDIKNIAPKQNKKSPLLEGLHAMEKEILRIVLNYGHKKIKIDVENQEGKIEQEEVLVIEYVLGDLMHEEIIFENSDYQLFLEKIIELLENEESVDLQSFFTNHEDDMLRNLAVDLLSNKYEISEGWGKHSIFPKSEEEKIDALVNRTLLPYKQKRVEKLIAENHEIIKLIEEEIKQLSEELEKDLANQEIALQIAGKEEEYFSILKEKTKLLTIKKQIAEMLGRVVVK